MPYSPTIREEDLKNFAVRHCIEADWLNDRDPFLWPADTWAEDVDFQLDCMVDAKDRYRSHFMVEFLRRAMGSFTAAENAKGAKDSGEALRSLRSLRQNETSAPLRLCVESPGAPSQGLLFGGAPDGRFVEASLPEKALRPVPTSDAKQAPLPLRLAGTPRFQPLAGEPPAPPEPLAAEAGMAYEGEKELAQSPPSSPSPSSETSRTSRTSREENPSAAREAVLSAGRALWRHYHEQPGALTDASFYDIRAHFQGFNSSNGHMNPDSPAPEYTRLLADLRAAMRALAAQIAPTVREHGFLR